MQYKFQNYEVKVLQVQYKFLPLHYKNRKKSCLNNKILS